MSAELAVIAAGAVTPVGLTTPQTCAAIRAGISAFDDSGFVLPSADFEPVTGATVPMRPLPAASTPGARCAALARIALRECLAGASLEPERTMLFLGIPEKDRLDRFKRRFGEDFIRVMERRVLSYFHKSSALLPYGNTAAFAALTKAKQALDAGAVDICVVGGVDSLLNFADVDEIQRTWRVLRKGETYGLIPGEAAAFVAVTRNGATRHRRLGSIAGIGFDREDPQRTVLAEDHPSGEGLLRALRAAIDDARLVESTVGLRITDLNGERYGAIDSMLAMNRFYRADRDGLPIWHPAECIGETGAAVGALMIQLACHAMTCGYAPSNTAMCEASSDSGMRAACVILASAAA